MKSTCKVCKAVVVTLIEPSMGFFGCLRLPLNDVQGNGRRNRVQQWTCEGSLSPPSSSHSGIPAEGRIGATTVDAEAQSLRHSEAAGRGIPYGGAEQSVVVSPREPYRGFPRAARE